MPRQQTITLYQFDELADSAKDKARYWFREASCGDNYFAEHLTDKFVELLGALGFDISTRRGTTDKAIYWDTNPAHASFEGSWTASRVNADGALDKLLKDRPASYRDPKSHRRKVCEGNVPTHTIAQAFRELAKQFPESEGIASSHRDWQRAEFQPNNYDAAAGTYSGTEWERIEDEAKEACETFGRLVKELSAQFAADILKEWDYQFYGEGCDESIRANEYEFYEDGKRAPF
jgi:hypothetical protein